MALAKRAPKKPARRSTQAKNGAGEIGRAPGRGKYDRTRSPDEREREQLRRLLDSAGHVFAEVGWADATVEAIVSRAGMSRRTFYEHFDDLRGCLLELHQRVAKVSLRTIEGALSAQSEPRQMLETGVTTFLGGIARFPHMSRVMFRVIRSAGPEFEKLHEQMMEKFAKLFLESVERSYQMGRSPKAHDDLRVYTLVAGMEGVAMRYVMRGDEEKALEAAPVLIDMIRKVFS
jgi:AcrR family transcriptional regulator